MKGAKAATRAWTAGSGAEEIEGHRIKGIQVCELVDCADARGVGTEMLEFPSNVLDRSHHDSAQHVDVTDAVGMISLSQHAAVDFASAG